MNVYHQYDSLLSAEELGYVAKAREFCTGSFSENLLAAHMAGEAFPERWIADWAAIGMLGPRPSAPMAGWERPIYAKSGSRRRWRTTASQWHSA
ncbi:hypothetical protein [Tardiphaga robiniae]|uniref:hypothetical protein n=1 Tax=Tardiphaga robiniae TaxID=943830 RepID=UPI001FCEDEC1|nr:hypothetical protein [Tardiphaga robiniae]